MLKYFLDILLQNKKFTTRSIKPIKHQNASDSFSITTNKGDKKSLMPCTYPKFSQIKKKKSTNPNQNRTLYKSLAHLLIVVNFLAQYD